MSKIATLRQVCQLTVDHLHTFNGNISPLIKDADFSNIIKQFILLYIVQYVSQSIISLLIQSFLLVGRSSITYDKLSYSLVDSLV